VVEKRGIEIKVVEEWGVEENMKEIKKVMMKTPQKKKQQSQKPMGESIVFSTLSYKVFC
jgi:hypothetical protein